MPDSPGWSDEQKETVDRMWAEIRQLSIDVVDHPQLEERPYRHPGEEPHAAEAAGTPGRSL
ncbi:hypothetical protein [Streptomyces sp. NPDC092307]|uniref:hypothetical protein n=1 Tax=Streptomyces sp. NPDC092307 TaxID=3366013 RepID=UPI00380F1242